MKALSRNAAIAVVIVLIIIVLAVVAINPTGQIRAIVSEGEGGSGSVGSLYVSTNPTAANLYVDNALKGTTPRTVYGLQAGNHSVRLTKSGYNDYATSVYIMIGQTTTLTVTLTPTSNQTNQTGSLYATSTPTAASLYVDNVLKGTTPRTVSELSIGLHTARFTKTGYQDYTAPFTIIAGQTTNLHATLNQTNTTDNPPTITAYYNGTTNLTNSTGVGMIVAVANDDIDLTYIRIYADGSLKRTCNIPGTTYGDCVAQNIYGYGFHTYYATATDSGGHTVESAHGNFTIP